MFHVCVVFGNSTIALTLNVSMHILTSNILYNNVFKSILNDRTVTYENMKMIILSLLLYFFCQRYMQLS